MKCVNYVIYLSTLYNFGRVYQLTLQDSSTAVIVKGSIKNNGCLFFFLSSNLLKRQNFKSVHIYTAGHIKLIFLF